MNTNKVTAFMNINKVTALVRLQEGQEKLKNVYKTVMVLSFVEILK